MDSDDDHFMDSSSQEAHDTDEKMDDDEDEDLDSDDEGQGNRGNLQTGLLTSFLFGNIDEEGRLETDVLDEVSIRNLAPAMPASDS